MSHKPCSVPSYVAVAVLLVLAGLCGLGLSGCSASPPWHLANIEGHLPDLRFKGQSQNGAEVDAEAVKGSVVLLYFGFTHCAEDCPIIMARVSSVLADLGPLADQVRVVFVSLDPSHDHVPVLGRYLAAFGQAHSIGLTASDAATEALAKRYRVAFYPARAATLAADLPHSSAVYVFDQRGRVRLLMTPRDSNASVEQDLRRLVAEGSATALAP